MRSGGLRGSRIESRPRAGLRATNRSPFGAKEKRLMRKLVTWFCLAWLVAGWNAPASAQWNYPVPPVDFTGPLSHPRYETGGFFFAIEGLFMSQNRPIKSQALA